MKQMSKIVWRHQNVSIFINHLKRSIQSSCYYTLCSLYKHCINEYKQPLQAIDGHELWIPLARFSWEQRLMSMQSQLN